MSQSFVERNKAWLLPLLGLMAAGVVYMNVKMLGAKPAVIPDPPAGSAPAAPPVTAPAVPAAPAPPPSPRPMPVGGGPDLWADLHPLEAPAPLLNAREALLAKGTEPLKGEVLAGPVVGVSAQGRGPRLEEAPPPPAAPTPSTAPAALRPVPEVDFLIRNARGSAAWLDGTGFREGQELAPGWRVKRISGGMVEVEGPGGRVKRFTNALAAESETPKAPRREVP